MASSVNVRRKFHDITEEPGLKRKLIKALPSIFHFGRYVNFGIETERSIKFKIVQLLSFTDYLKTIIGFHFIKI